MVVLNEMTSVFWGVALEGGKRKYSQTTTKPVHISMAALDPTRPCGDGPISVMIEHGTGSYVLCTLKKDVIYQQPLNLEFAAGEELSFYMEGNGIVHLSGFFMPEDDYEQYSDLEDSDEDDDEIVSGEDDSNESEDESDEEQVKKGKKRQISNVNKKSKKAKSDFTFGDLSEDDEDDSEDNDFIIDEAEEASDDDDEDDDEEFEDDVDESPKAVKNKKKKETPSKVAVVNTGKPKGEAVTQQTPGKKQDGSQNKKVPQPSTATISQSSTTTVGSTETDGKKKKKKKKNKKKGNQEQTTEPTTTQPTSTVAPVSKSPMKRVADGGVVIEDLKVGHGPEAKVGQMVRVYYTGRLSNGKAFDCCTSGNGFKFKLGKKEVISGWDVGVSGMKVGGKRKLVIPPKMGYGPQKAGPIPPNSTLVFDVELKAVG